MDELFLDVGLPDRIAPFVPPVCLSPLTVQILAIALILVVGLALQETFWPSRDPRR
ncbi:hypothetical protein ABIE45_003878 [Methylobacterium sp. OAE515]|uniref:hypothetical protein n=1 Tax=Methylobacterium sp. OAE515 TaxID=2817895 RepID=UPI001789294B